jgi:hypothetical protein
MAPDVYFETPGSLLKLSHIYPMGLHLSHLRGKRKDVYTYLANAQRTKFAVTPVHTQMEFKLFHNAVSIGGQWFVSHGQPNFDAMCQWWSSQANGKTIFYKLREHLSTYYKTWIEHHQGIRTLIASENQRQAHTHRIRSKHHSATVLQAASQQHPGVQADVASVPEIVTVDRMDVEASIVDVETAEPVDDVHVDVPAAIIPPLEFHAPLTVVQNMGIVSQIQPATMLDTNFRPWTGNRVRKERRCHVCQQTDCPGRGNRHLCKRSSQNVSSLTLLFSAVSDIVTLQSQ